MIRVRYRDSNEFSPGLHAAAECHGRTTTVYLLSGLTTPQRRSALRRLRLSARMGHCPRLPAARLAFALLAGWIRTAIGRVGAVFRLHPAGSTLPVMVLSGGAIAFLLFSTVSIRVLPAPRTAPQSSAPGALPVATAGAIPISGASLARPPSLAAAGPGAGTGSGSGDGQGSGTSSGGGTTLSGGADPTPTSAPKAAGSTPPPAATTPPHGAAAPSAPKPASSSTSQGGVCVNVGPLGACLNI
jgi:uncharacterized membrane protein YgcG